MENKSLPMPVVIAIIAAVVLLVGFFGWRAMSGGSSDKNGVDLSKPAERPANGQPSGGPGAGYPGGTPQAAGTGK